MDLGRPLPIMHSTFAGDGLAGLVAQVYDVPRVRACNLLSRGLNDTYRVATAGPTFILRVYRTPWRTHRDVLYELEAISMLHEGGLAVAAPIRTRSGDWAVQVAAPEGTRDVVLFSYAPGEVPRLNPEISQAYGRLAARMHSLTARFETAYARTPLDLRHLITQPLEQIRRVMPRYSDALPYVEQWAECILRDLPTSKLDWGFCHGDLHDWNVHMKDSVLTLFDFDCCGPGFRAYDLAVFLWNLTVNYPTGIDENWSAFLAGYSAVRPVDAVDVAATKLLVAARRFWLAGLYLTNEDVWGAGLVNRGFFRSFVEQLQSDETRCR
ncbi:MAG: phosphotransferase [Alicyclobacillus sp.]|nr:phosphotransferase [Alicyclobacillus sp.]